MKKCYRYFQVFKMAFEEQIMGRPQFLKGFLSSEKPCYLVKDEHSGFQWRSKIHENVAAIKECTVKNEKSLCVKLLTCWQFHLCQFRAFWKTLWMCVRLLPNFCPTLLTLALCEFLAKKKKRLFLLTHSTHWIFHLLSSPKTQGDVKGKEI